MQIIFVITLYIIILAAFLKPKTQLNAVLIVIVAQKYTHFAKETNIIYKFCEKIIIMDKTLILNEIINHLFDGSKSKFAKKLGVTPQTVSSWLSRNTFDIELIYAKCEVLSADWLLTGAGSMFKKETPLKQIENVSTNTLNTILNTLKGIIKEQATEIARLEIEVENIKNTSKNT